MLSAGGEAATANHQFCSLRPVNSTLKSLRFLALIHELQDVAAQAVNFHDAVLGPQGLARTAQLRLLWPALETGSPKRPQYLKHGPLWCSWLIVVGSWVYEDSELRIHSRGEFDVNGV